MIESFCQQHGELIDFVTVDKLYCHDDNFFWYVAEGEVDLFIEHTDDASLTPFIYFNEDSLIFTGKWKRGYFLRAKFSSNARLYQVPVETIKDLPEEYYEEFQRLLEKWIAYHYQNFIRIQSFNKFTGTTKTYDEILKQGDLISTRKGVAWLKFKQGSGYLLNDSGMTFTPDMPCIPLHESGWLTIHEDSQVETLMINDLIRSGAWLSSIQAIFNYVLNTAIDNLEIRELAKYSLLTDKLNNDQKFFEHAITNLSKSFSYETHESSIELEDLESEDILISSIIYLFKIIKMPIKIPTGISNINSDFEKFKRICDASKVYYRPITLESEWKQFDHPPIFVINNYGKPKVIVFHRGKNKQYDPKSKSLVTMSAKDIAAIPEEGYSVCRRLPNDKPLKLVDLSRFSISEDYLSIISLVGIFTLTTLMAMLTPIFSKVIFDRILPYGEVELFAQITFVLFAVVFITLLLNLTSRYIINRLFTRTSYLAQSALYDRILKLPATFFAEYSTGDIQERITGILQIRSTLGGTTFMTLLNAVFSTTSLVLMFIYSPFLASIATVVVFFSGIISYILGSKNLKYSREAANRRGELAGVLTELVSGISILRSSGAESRAFYHWSSLYSKLSKVSFKSFILGIIISSANSMTSLISIVIIFISIYFINLGDQNFSAGDFMAFNAAFIQFSGGVLGLINTVVSLLNIVPLYERAKPILQAVPEINENLIMPEQINGKIELNNISFKYPNTDKLILNKINLTIEPGSFVSLVGESGCGKSTLLRIILGFEKATDGRIYFDNIDSEQLDVAGYRSNIGVVLQGDSLTTGGIYSNICGNNQLTRDEVWDLLKAVNMDKEVAEMPMKLDTMVGLQAMGLSGGQRQRIMIARALANNPKIMIMDEATSALDSISQGVIMNTLEKLKITKIFVAHRLSTVRNSDVIFVIKDGHVIESGDYEQLMEQNGYFSSLVKKQVI